LLNACSIGFRSGEYLGRQRGTSRREDALDTVIALRRPADYSPEEGARFEVHVEKARTLAGEGALPFEAAVEPFVAEAGLPGIRWVARDLKPPIFQQAAELFAQGASVREVKQALRISHGEAGRLRHRPPPRGFWRRGRRMRGRRAKVRRMGHSG
jgi:putative DNA primase/helicase